MTYARRYALFALVGIAGEDDRDASDMAAAPVPSPIAPHSGHGAKGRRDQGVLQRPPMLGEQKSANLRDALLGELAALRTGQELLAWAKKGLVEKNTLLEAHARSVESAYSEKLAQVDLSLRSTADAGLQTTDAPPSPAECPAGTGLELPKHPPRKRSKAHLLFLRGQPCVVCRHSPCDAHHLKFAQPRALGRKVSDEFTVPLCRTHHQDLHRHGNEKAWWTNLQLDPLPIASQLWQASPIHPGPRAVVVAASGGMTGSEGIPL